MKKISKIILCISIAIILCGVSFYIGVKNKKSTSYNNETLTSTQDANSEGKIKVGKVYISNDANKGNCKAVVDGELWKEGQYIIFGKESGGTVKITDTDGKVILDSKTSSTEGIVIKVPLKSTIELFDSNAERIKYEE